MNLGMIIGGKKKLLTKELNTGRDPFRHQLPWPRVVPFPLLESFLGATSDTSSGDDQCQVLNEDTKLICFPTFNN